jgi:phosphate uptake regulator
LFSAAKDAERLGDYCKNLQEVAGFCSGKAYPQKWFPRIRKMHETITQFFTRTALAFSQADEAEAKALMEDFRTLGHECDEIVEELLAGNHSLNAQEAVAVCLTVRYFKRTAAHISNIASGIVNPVHKIDYLKS